MALISPEERQTLKTHFEQELQDDVNIIYFTQRESVLIVPGQECAYCKETRELLEEVTDISDKLHLTVKDFVRDEQEAQNRGITHIPAFILQVHTKGSVRYFGIPAGYEFSTLIEDLIEVSEFIDLAQRYQVQGVPKTVVNDRIEMVGAYPEPRFMQEVLKAVEPEKEA